MINQYNGYKPEQMKVTNQLPVGGYVLRILDATIEEYKWGQKLRISFDVDEGVEAGFFAEQYKENTRDDRKWKGVLRLTVPKDMADCQDDKEIKSNDYAVRRFNDFIFCVEDSNNGYRWNWDEKTLTDKVFGCVFRSEEWEWEGKTGWRTAPFKVVTVDDIQGEKFTIPDPKPLAVKQANAYSGGYAAAGGAKPNPNVSVEDDELPF